MKTKLSPVIERLCTDPQERSKFEVLSQYFGKLTPNDFNKSELTDFVSLVNVEHRILMTIFIDSYLRPSINKDIGNNTLQVQILPERGKIDASLGRVQSSQIEGNGSGAIKITGLAKYLKSRIGSHKFKVIDLSNNNLLSIDLRHVYDMILALDGSLDNCIINLENNRIHGVGEEFRNEIPELLDSLCALPFIKYIILRNNPFCSVDRKDYFQSLTVDSIVLSKLIWIQIFALDGNFWKTMLQGYNELQKMVYKVHQSFQEDYGLIGVIWTKPQRIATMYNSKEN
jgi:hypothetical protein